MAFADFNGDEAIDVALSVDQNPETWARVYFNDGTGIFTYTEWYFSVICCGTLDVGDYDGDSDIDILISGTTTVGGLYGRIYENDGFGNFTNGPTQPFSGYWG